MSINIGEILKLARVSYFKKLLSDQLPSTTCMQKIVSEKTGISIHVIIAMENNNLSQKNLEERINKLYAYYCICPIRILAMAGIIHSELKTKILQKLIKGETI
jgi:predicted xylose isomerase-like sugar epimerase